MNTKTRTLVRFAILAAILIIMSLTPLGYLKVGVIEISFLCLPVVVGAALMGPAAGALLGLIFGLTSFAQCFTGSPFGSLLAGLSIPRTFLVCVPTRVLMGLLVGVIFRAMYKSEKLRRAAYVVASGMGAVLNTVFFTLTLFALFGANAEFMSAMGAAAVTIKLLAGFVGVNGIVEAAVCVLFGLALPRIAKAVYRMTPEDELAELEGGEAKENSEKDA